MADNLYKETFSHVRSSYEFNMEDFEKKRPKRRFPVRKLVFAAAAAAALAALAVTASATGFFGLTEPQPEHEAPDIPKSPDVVFVEGYDETPEGRAWAEYAAGAGALEDVAAKYGLTVPERSEVLTYSELTALQGGELFGAGHAPAAASVLEDGSFRLEGEFTGSGGERAAYELKRAVKGSLAYADLMGLGQAGNRSVRPFDAGERTLALIEGGGETLLAADLGDAWAVLRLRGTDLDTGLLGELGGSVNWDALAAVVRPDFPEKAKPVVFGAGVELSEENIIAGQSFSVRLAGLGRVRFISYAPTEEFTDVRFFFSADGAVSLQELTPVLTGLTFEKVAAVSFEDLTGDSYTDILLLIDYRDAGGEAYRHVRIFTAQGDGSFTLETRISRNIEASVDNGRLDVAAVRAWLRASGSPGQIESPEGFAQVLADNRREYGGGYFTRYTVFDLTGDGEPELIAGRGTCEADAEWDIWTMEDGEPRLLGTIGAGHSLLYERDGELLRLFGQMGGEIIDRIVWDGSSIREETLSERELGPDEDYAVPGRALVMAPPDDLTLIEPSGFEEVIRRAGERYAGPDSLAGYVLYDMDGDGGQELILRVEDGGIAEYRFYALSQGRAVPLGTVQALYDDVLAAGGTTLYLVERALEYGSESIYIVTYTDSLTETFLSARRGLSPADFTDPERLGEILELTAVSDG